MAGGIHRTGSEISRIIASMPGHRSMSATARRDCTASKFIAAGRSFTISATSSFQTATEPGHYDDEVWQSVIAECRFLAGRFQEMRLIPLQLNATGVGGPGDLKTRGRPSLARGPAADIILDRLARLSQPFGTTFTREDGAA